MTENRQLRTDARHRVTSSWSWLSPFILLGLLPLFFVGGPDWASSALHKSVWNLGHPLFFGLLTHWLSPRLPLRERTRWLAVTVAVLVAGGLVELAQEGLQRQRDWHDMLRNLIGAWLVLAWQTPPQPALHPITPTLRWLARGLTLILLIVELSLVAQAALQHYRIQQHLPGLYDFSANDPHAYWSGAISRVDHLQQGPATDADSAPALKIALGTEQYSGVSLHNLPSDWRDYHALMLAFFNPSDSPLELVIRINDARHDRGDNAFRDRFNQRLSLQPGYNQVRIELDRIRTAPVNRDMDMDDIRRLGLFAVRLPAPREIYLLNIALELP
ncbi:succinyl-CoA synthetase subunit beta [Marinobacter zhejiangensis]|uniref:Uncharacterized protein n=1 Tax=Marinobacter zhejiangensis TaxID=488535 RepID=A0A1I4QBM0_9GAMM|nr:succinyl-CoA synthetase subunit beta [Marinobacter zhejiangensis]SFM37033.1 hypothetical protein SAMN04487963_2276 [Marinobacter zhejiangensis]